MEIAHSFFQHSITDLLTGHIVLGNLLWFVSFPDVVADLCQEVRSRVPECPNGQELVLPEYIVVHREYARQDLCRSIAIPKNWRIEIHGNQYTIISIIKYIDMSMHYVTYVKLNGAWTCYDDDCVGPASNLPVAMAALYLLERQQVEEQSS